MNEKLLFDKNLTFFKLKKNITILASLIQSFVSLTSK